MCMPAFGFRSSDLGSESEKLVLFYQFGFDLIMMYYILGTVLPATESDSDFNFCFQSYQGRIIDRSLVY